LEIGRTPTSTSVQRIDPYSARLFIAILEEGSIARAARIQHIVQSAVSRRLGDLEALFGVPLVQRHARGVTPTPAGEALAHHARLLLRTLERMELEMTEYRFGVRGHVRLRCSSSALSTGLPGALQLFTAKHHGVKLDLEEQDTPEVFQQVAAGHADIGVAPDIVAHEGVHVFPYHRYDLCAIVPQDHPLARVESVLYDEILAYDLVELTRKSALSSLLDAAAASTGASKRTRIRTLGFEGVCRMVGAGIGVGVAPSFLASTHGPLYGLRFVPLQDRWAHPLVCVIVREPAQLPPAARLLMTELCRSWPGSNGTTTSNG